MVDYFFNRLAKSNSLSIDSTFIHTYGYIQTLIIMFLDTEINKFFPGIYILLNNKTEFIYTQSLNYIKNKINDINPYNLHLKTITCDFEQGLINAINNAFLH